MAVLPQDRRGQMFLFLSIFAAAGIWFTYSGTPVGGVPGIGALGDSARGLQARIDSLTAQVQTAQRTMTSGALPALERALASYQGTLDLMRRLVPVSTEIPDLLDDIASRARMRGAEVINFVPVYPPESGSPFDTQRARFTVTGQYDALGEFLSDVASLPRIIVPHEVRIERVAGLPGADSARARANNLRLTFQIRTYVRAQVDTTAAPGAPPAAPGGGDD
jgi:Tfp pilus assembly protein PilO